MELAALNWCRMFLHVIFISDITNGQGTTIDKQYWSGSLVSETHNYHWPQTTCPMPKEWKQWQQVLTRSLNLGQVQMLALPLGKWHALTLEFNGWFTNAEGLQLFHKSDQKWTSFTPALLCQHLCSFHTTPMAISDNAQQIELLHMTIYKHGQLITLSGYGKIEKFGPGVSNNLFKPFWTWQKCNLRSEGQMMNLIQAIHDGQAMAVSNSTFKDQAGAVVWMIEGHTAVDCLWGTGLTPGQLEDQSVYWSELFGLWSILASLKQLVESHNITYGQLTIACDGKAALKKAQQEYLTEPSKAHYDLISAIRNL